MPKRARRPRPHQADYEDEIPYIPPRTEEQLLIQHLASYQAERLLCTTHGRGQLAGFLASQNPQSRVECLYLDSHHAQLARDYWQQADHPPVILCQPDLPEQEYDAICMPVLKQGNAELTRELLQQAHLRLKPRGELIAAVDNPRDHWLYEQFKEMFPKVTRLPKKRGILYAGKKQEPLKKVRDFRAEFTVPLADRELQLCTRPGVFSHRHLDDGAWALIKALTRLPLKNGSSVLDLGCGCGAVGIAAMLSAENMQVTAIDSHARAIACTEENARRNLSEAQLARFHVELSHTTELNSPRQFDVVATNPPYFSRFQIAERFIEAARRMLRPQGQLLLVTKMPHWYEEHMPQWFRQVEQYPSGHYTIVQARN